MNPTSFWHGARQRMRDVGEADSSCPCQLCRLLLHTSRYMLTCLVWVHTRGAQDKEPAGTRQSGTTALTRAAQVMSTCIVLKSIELGAASLPRRVIHFLHNLVSLLMYISLGLAACIRRAWLNSVAAAPVEQISQKLRRSQFMALPQHHAGRRGL